MKITDLVSALNLKVLSGHNGLNNEIKGGYVSDLLSDVMGNANGGMVWITVQTHPNIVAVASLKDLAGIIIVKDLIPENETINKSNTENIPILSCDSDTFKITGSLYDLIKLG
jgi:predicted transcriptional regulator